MTLVRCYRWWRASRVTPRGRPSPRVRAVLELGWEAPSANEKLASASVSASLERLRLLAPFAKPALLRACVEVAMADGVLRIAEAELLRAIAATLDCPVPPVLAA